MYGTVALSQARETKERRENGFKKVAVQSGLSVFMLETRASFCRSRELVESSGLRLLTHREAMMILTRNATLRKRLEGKSFWLSVDDYDFPKEKALYILKEGSLEMIPQAIKREQTVQVFPGGYLREFEVATEHNSILLNRCFTIFADGRLNDYVPVVMGISRDLVIAADSNIERKLLRKGVIVRGLDIPQLGGSALNNLPEVSIPRIRREVFA